ncbi:MAG: response regulator, partial [Gammaproteobacteria bacterium]|nr:response regulator [Gammaproteobacteria bacterium]
PSNQFVDTLTMMNESIEADYDDELVEIFIEEATELLDMSDHTLHTWAEQDESIDDSANFGLVMELQRYLHTLKGGAKMAEFNEISDLSHELESLFIAVIDARVEKSDDLIDALHDSFDLLSIQVNQAKNHQPLESSAKQIDALLQLRSSDVEQHKNYPEIIENKESVESDVSPVLSSESDFDEAVSSPVKEEAANDRRKSERDVVKVRSELLDNLVNSAGEVSIYRARMEQQVSSFGSNLGELGSTIIRLKNQLRALEAETDAQIHFSHKDDTELKQSFDPLEMDRYTQIQELSKSLGESVDDLSSLQSILGDQVKDSETLLLQQSRINTDLQDGLIRSRMVRFSGLTSRLRRLVRKTSSELAKKADLVIEGDQHEVDIKVLDRMLAPIEHILRNSISHGIESPIERVNKGKSESGKILIKVSRDGSDVVLKISDDGSGVNVRKVRARAVELGLLGEREEIDENDVVQFILEPGFSTADHVTQVAGRGVGMDVVASGIKQLGGTLQISTSPQGTVFTARLPFTLSINQAILVQAGDESFALPLINIEGITRIESDQMAEIYQQEKPVLDYAGQQYSLYYLSSLLDASNSFKVIDDALKVPVILLRSGDLRVALHIDVLLGNREIVVKPLGKLLSQVKGISGASILADGLVVLILDINGLIRHGITSFGVTRVPVEIEEEMQQPETKSKKVVMVVDDSITMRRVATKLLNRNNYDVVTAKDGVDALAQLEDVNPDVMLLDIEMPRMDGFELALHMKNEANYRDIPIIMITSRTGTKHREHAKKIGVDKYMGKPYQEEELIENISALAR